MSEVMLSVEELGKYLDLTPQTIYVLARKGKIPGVKVGGSWRFPLVVIHEWMESQARKTMEGSK